MRSFNALITIIICFHITQANAHIGTLHCKSKRVQIQYKSPAASIVSPELFLHHFVFHLLARLTIHSLFRFHPSDRALSTLLLFALNIQL